MSIYKILNPRNDLAFKKVFGTDQNKHLVISFLNSVLSNQMQVPIEDVVFLKKDQDPEIASKRQSVVDILCRDKAGIQYVIEMQVAKSAGFKERAALYASRAYLSQINRDTKYPDLKEVIFLALCDFNIFPKKTHYKSEHQLMDMRTFEHDLKAFSFTFVDLPKFEKSLLGQGKALKDLSLEEKWYYFLRKGEGIDRSHMDSLVGKDNIIKEAFSAIHAFNWSDGELAAYEDLAKAELDNEAALDYREKKGEEKGLKKGLKEGLKEGRKEGIEEGLEKGRQEGIEKMKLTARKMLKAGVPKEDIQAFTGLSIQALEHLE